MSSYLDSSLHEQYLPEDTARQWPIISQHPSIAPSEAVRTYAESEYLPKLIHAWQAVESITKYRWKCTSYWRNSPTHQHGEALDIAPDISDASNHLYAVTNGSDPVLYKRTSLMRALQRVCESMPWTSYLVGFFVECDHIHIQLLQRTPEQEAAGLNAIVIKWKQTKDAYSDSSERILLPMTKGKGF